MLDSEPTIAQIQLWYDTGRTCCSCGATFTQAHGRVTACGYCYKRMTSEERGAVQKATHEEVVPEGHRKLARDRRAARQERQR